MSYAIWNNNLVYDSNTQDNDIIILKLSKALKLNNKVQAACLPSSSWKPENDSNNKCFVSGWGALKQGITTYALSHVK